MNALLDTAAPFARTSFEPGHFTASAFVLAPDEASLLLIYHEKLGSWFQPGGHVDASDASLVHAARREVSEEVGLLELLPLRGDTGIFDVDIHRIPPRPTEPAHEHFDVRFAFVAGTQQLRLDAEVRQARWVALSEVGDVTTDESVLRAVEKIRRLRA